jgi:KDO2-lipid IV(A) lauroyltransferase
VARVLSPRLFMTACHAVARLAARRLAGPRRRVAAGMRAIFPAVPEEQVQAWATAAVEGFLVRAAQDLVTTRLVVNGQLRHVTVQGAQHLETARAAGRGVVICSGHFLATRLARRWLASQGISMRSTRKAIPPTRTMSRWGRRVLQPAYERFLHEVIRDEIFVAERGSTLRILRHLREGGILYAHLDTNFSSRAVEHPLLGQPERIGAGLLEALHLTGAPLVPAEFAGDWRRLRIEFFEPLTLVEARDRQSFVLRNVALIVTTLEELIRRQPDQWEYWMLGWPADRQVFGQ